MHATVQEYIDQQPTSTQGILLAIRSQIHILVPEAEECMSYGVPAFKLGKKNLIMYAAFKEHVGIYPEPDTIEAFRDKLTLYETSKGTIKFSLRSPIPYDLIGEIVKYRYAKILTSTTTRSKSSSLEQVLLA